MNILQSFEQQDSLNSKFWTKPDNPSESKMKKEVRQRLLEIAYEFFDFLEVDVVISDVQMTGSLANYNWSDYSDVDLHLLIDYNQIPEDQLELYQQFFKLKKTIFNLQHNIKIYGYDVELYVQDMHEKRTKSGAYSVLNNEWFVVPTKENPKYDKEVLKDKIDSWVDKIEGVIEDAKDDDLDIAKEKIGKLMRKIKEYRVCGLKKGGEFSYENLVFKYLRRSGHIGKLLDLEIEKMDKELSLRELKTIY